MTTEETAASEGIIEPALESTEFDSSGYKIIIDLSVARVARAMTIA
ncbi:MAG: hypothetical protein AAF149_03335 [Bacteroidota bacterium]